MAFVIEPFEKSRHDRAAFSSGQPSLDAYLQKQVSQDLKRRVAAVFVLRDEASSQVLGYYTLSAYSIELSQVEEALAKRLPRYPLLPATLLGRLAMDEVAQGKGLGALLLLDALQRSHRTAAQIASMAVVAEAMDERAARFYAKYGFEPFGQDALQLYLPMGAIAKLFE